MGENTCKINMWQRTWIKIYKELSKFTKSDISKHISKKDIQIAKMYMKRHSVSLVNMKMHIKTTISYHYTSTRIAKIKKNDNTKCSWGCGANGILIHYWWNVNWCNHTGKLFGHFHSPIWSSHSTPRCFLREINC